ncbi:TVP38/TMEM64 family membrane protein [Mycobacterium marinum]|nr:TVP38/TMEM64 family membrane protein [Mycobacterium marinum]GJO07098.1 TVP38/TMEM64 family membrane protein [Mycobacterium marinum]GJO11973.1 TVP38/TMEM64 family membrane protein [Mycobacterium marinum]GJO15609.1 TVP38/TMEM64 family membrane protein [Mycobacterium marinum]GJO18007.1 TVP38/TMEM64 family membrane protein [Mycobacterium marinum]
MIVTASVLRKTTDTVRGIALALRTAARQMSRLRKVSTVAGITLLVAVALLVPLPTAVQMRDWASSVGPWLPLVFLLVHIVVTVPPFPRTAFTVAGGLLFGPVLGIVIAVTASTASAVIALLLVRAAGWRLNRLVPHGAVDRLDERLRERGWLAILSLRLIPAVPFAALNYGAGASAVRVVPYTLSTLAGLLPGTVAVVILGSALAGDGSPLLVLVSVCTAALGMSGLVFEVRQYRRHHRHQAPSDHGPVLEPACEPLGV